MSLKRVTVIAAVAAMAAGLLLACELTPHAARPRRAGGSGLERRPLLTATVERGKTVVSVQAAQIDFAPGEATGIHRHPIPVVGYVTRGAFEFQLEGGPLATLVEGSAFYEPPNIRVMRFDNASERESASIVAFYLLGQDDRELIAY